MPRLKSKVDEAVCIYSFPYRLRADINYVLHVYIVTFLFNLMTRINL